jgi:ADP-ribosylglycohydrolase
VRFASCSITTQSRTTVSICDHGRPSHLHLKPADRIYNSLLGGALGDAIGSAHEGSLPPTRVEVPSDLKFSDDTQLTLATCEAIIQHGGIIDPAFIATSFAAWFRRGHITGIGSSTLKALRDLRDGAHWALAGAQGERSAGNGAAMRIAPIAFLVDSKTPDGRTLIWDIARITHRNDEACCGAFAVAHAIRLAFLGHWQPGQPLVRTVAKSLPDSCVRDRLLELDENADASLGQIAADYGASGYVVDSVCLAIAAAERLANDTLSNALLAVVSCGGDTDTNASITGQILGCVRPLAETRLVHDLPTSGHEISLIFSEFAGVATRPS